MVSTEHHRLEQAEQHLPSEWQSPLVSDLPFHVFVFFFTISFWREMGAWTRLWDHLATTLPELILPALRISSQLHALLTRTTTPQRRPREATSIFDLTYKELEIAQIGHGWSRRHQGRQRCSAGGGSAKRGGEQREGWGRCRGCSRLKPHSEIKSEGSTAAIFPPPSCVLHLLYSKIVIIMSTKRPMVSFCN